MEYRPRSRKFVTLLKKMLIGDISKKTGLSKDTIRFYEKRGLIKVNQSHSKFNNYKNYSFENFQRLELIKKAKKFGFTLNEIAELLELVDLNRANCSLFRSKVMAKIEDIDRRIHELSEMKATIFNGMINAQFSCNNNEQDGNCSELKYSLI